MATSVKLPSGFVLDEQPNIPVGFVLDNEKYPAIATAKDMLERGLATGGKMALDVLKRSAIPAVSPEISKSFIEKPALTFGTLATGTGLMTAPVSTAGAFLTRKALETPTGKKGIEASQNIVSKIPNMPFLENVPVLSGIQNIGKLARVLPPEAYAEIPKTGLETAAFMGLSKLNKPALDIIKSIPEHMPTPMGKGYKLARAETIAQDVEDLKHGIGEKIGEELEKLTPSGQSTYGNLYVDSGIDKDIAETIDKNMLKKIKESGFGVKFIGNKIEKTVNNIHRFRRALADQMTGKDWYDATSNVKQNIGRMFGKAGDYMKNKVPELSPLFDEFSGFMQDVYEPATNVLYKSGKVSEKPLSAALRPGAEERLQQAFDALRSMSETSKTAMSDLVKHAGRQATKKQIGNIAKKIGIGAGTLILGGLGLKKSGIIR